MLNKKEAIALDIVREAQRLSIREMIEPMVVQKSDGRFKLEGAPLPGYREEVLPLEEVEAVTTGAADYELWWCRAIALQQGLSVGFIDWFWYNKALDLLEEENSTEELSHES